MSRAVATSVANDLSAGWVTDATGMNFPEKGVVDAENIKFSPDGRVIRRRGFAVDEAKAVPGSAGATIVSSYTWQGVEQDSVHTILAIQADNMVHFYDTTTTLEPDLTTPLYSIDLTTHRPAGSTVPIGKCQFALATGELVIVNQACDPIRVSYKKATGVFSVDNVDIKIRDFKGLKTPGFPNDKRTTDTFDNLSANNPRYLYNLVSNGWTSENLRGWDAARTDLPSQEEFKGHWRNDESNTFDVTKVKDEYATTKVYGGHMILDAFNPDRVTSLNEALTGATTTTDTPGTFTPTSVTNCKGSYPKANPVFKTATALSMSLSGHDGALLTLTLYGADVPAAAGAPTTGAIIGSKSFNALVADGTVVSIPTGVDHRYNWYWIEVTTGVATLDCTSYSLDVTVSTTTADPVTFGPLADAAERTLRRPALVANWSNRMVYAGVYDTEYSTTIYMSKSIEDNERDLGRCYQDNDPTNIKNNQMLASDGLAIMIPDAVKITGLVSKDNDLVVLATNGTWILRGGREGVDAEKISVQKVSCAPCDSPCSVVEGATQPMWWGGDNIWTLVYNMQFYTYETKSLSKERINNYLLTIPDYNKTLVCGAYCCKSNNIIWLYNDGKELDVPAEIYNKALILSLDKGAFYRWGNVNNKSTDYQIKNVKCMQQGDRKSDGHFGYMTVTPAGVCIATESDEKYWDWGKFYYDSFLLSGYGTRGSGVRRQTGRYAHIFMDQDQQDEEHLYWTGDVHKQATKDVWGLARPSLYCQAIYDWDNTGSKWTKKQQVYAPRRQGRVSTVRRIKIRGRGRTMQLKFISENGHPFSLLGYAVVESGGSSE